jgi:hypothetical protein
MATFTLFQDFSEQEAKGIHQFGTHSFKWALSNVAPNAATNTVLADITQIANGGGYTGGAGGGYAADGVAVSQSGATVTVTCTDEVITATGGAIATFRYIILYNDSATSPADALVGFLDYGSAVDLADTETLTIDVGASGLFQKVIS